MKKPEFNTIEGQQLLERIQIVLNEIAERVGKTMGPYGHNILIPMTESTLSTKDGWHYLQNLHVKDPIDKIIKGLIEKCGQSVVLKVGDGSTTVTVAANALNNILTSQHVKTTYTIREIEDSLKRCVNTIIPIIKANAIDITDDNMAESIKKIALVSTNWDEELAQIISDIYVNTKNPIIKLLDGGTENTTYSIIDGYDINGKLLLDNYYTTDFVNGKCEVKNPIILTLGYTVQQKLVPALVVLGELAMSMGRKLVILAPGFEKSFLESIATQNRLRLKANKHMVNIVPASYVNSFIIDRDCVDDFCVMTGTALITKSNEDFDEFLNDTYDALTNEQQPEQSSTIQDKLQKTKPDIDIREMTIESCKKYLIEIGGTCDTLTITDRNITASGLTQMDTTMIDERKEKITSEINKKIKECDALTMLTDDIRMKRVRLGKLQGKMGVIYVGGYGDANLKAKKDALDDATRACEAAFRNGYTFGSGTAIGHAIQEISNNQEKYNVDGLDMITYNCIYGAFYKVFETLIANKYRGSRYEEKLKTGYCPSYIQTGSEKLDNVDKTLRIVNIQDIYNTCTDIGVAYNIKNDDIDNDGVVINPIDVDIEVLKGCLRLVTICITSDQMTIPPYAFNSMDESSNEEYHITEGR